MGTTTSKLGLYKPSETGENVDIDYFNDNFDKLDAAVGAEHVASSARPSAPYLSQVIYETDTKTTLTWDGSDWRPAASGYLFNSYLTSDAALGNNAATVFGAGGTMTVENIGFTFNSSTGALTIPLDGLYRVTLGASFQANATGSRGAWMAIGNHTGVRILNLSSRNAGGGDAVELIGSRIHRLVKGNTLQAGVFQDSGASLTVIGKGATPNFRSFIAVEYLRP